MKLVNYVIMIGSLAMFTTTKSWYYLDVQNHTPFTVHVHADVAVCSDHDWIVPPYGTGESKNIHLCCTRSAYAEIQDPVQCKVLNCGTAPTKSTTTSGFCSSATFVINWNKTDGLQIFTQ